MEGELELVEGEAAGVRWRGHVDGGGRRVGVWLFVVAGQVVVRVYTNTRHASASAATWASLSD